MEQGFRIPKNLKSIYGCYNNGQRKKNIFGHYKRVVNAKDYNVTIGQNVRKSLIDFPSIGNPNHYNSKSNPTKGMADSD